MALASSGRVAKEVTTSSDPTTPVIFNISIAAPDINVEQSQALPANTKEFILKTRSNGKTKLSYTVAESGTKFITINGDSSYNDSNFYTAQTLYFQVNKVDVVEIIAFT